MFGSHITDLPRFHNFNDAVNYFNKTKGIRGREHIKPLKTSRRSPDDFRIAAVKNGAGEIQAIQCWLYQTPVLVYYKNQLTINTYNSMTTNAFIHRVGPHWLGAYQENNSQVISIQNEGNFVGNEYEIVVPVDETYSPVVGGVIAPKLNEIVLNRTRAAEARKLCKHIIDLATTTSKLDGYWDALVKTDEVVEDADMAWLRGILKNGWYHTRDSWNGSTLHYFGGNGYPSTNTADLIPKLKKRLYQAQYSEHQCYDKFPAPYGVIPNEWEIV